MKTKQRRKGKRLEMESIRALHQEVLEEMLACWRPLATSKEWTLEKESRGKMIVEEEPVEMGLKVGAFVLKVMERWARLEGLDAAEKREVQVTEVADFQEVERRIAAVKPLLLEQLEVLRESGRIGIGDAGGGGEPRMAIASLGTSDLISD